LTRTEVLLSLDDSNTLRLIALDPTGQPISNLRSELNCGSTNPLEIETAALRSGNEWLILFDQAKLQNNPNDSTMYLNVFTKFGLGTIKFQIGELGPWTLRFSSPARLEVEVTGLRGSGFEAGLRVYIFKPNSNTPPIYTEKLNSEGRASFVSLPAAEVEVKLALSRDWGTIRFAERRITLSPGMNTLQISAPPASPLRISTTPGYQLSLEGFSNQTFFDSSWQPADPNGLADFGLVPHGRWSLFTLDWSDNFPVKIIEHRGPQDITVDFLKFSALLVKELDTPHHGIDLQEDDQITKINSKRFRNASELSAIEDEFTKESAIKLTITRAGALREVSISMEKWSELRTWALVD
jgi:hypothetical protein